MAQPLLDPDKSRSAAINPLRIILKSF